MISKETPNKPVFKNNFEEILWSIFQDVEEMESGAISLESIVSTKLQDALELYQRNLETNFSYLVQQVEEDEDKEVGEDIFKLTTRWNKRKENLAKSYEND